MEISKKKPKNAKSTQKTIGSPKQGCFSCNWQQIIKYVQEKKKEGKPITCKLLWLKPLEIGKDLNIPLQNFKQIVGGVSKWQDISVA